jgi:hypothetical protein
VTPPTPRTVAGEIAKRSPFKSTCPIRKSPKAIEKISIMNAKFEDFTAVKIQIDVTPCSVAVGSCYLCLQDEVDFCLYHPGYFREALEVTERS